MKKTFSLLLALLLVLGLLPALAEEAPPQLPYQLIVSVEDWGAAIPLAILHLPAEVEKDKVDKDSVTVTVRRQDARGDEPLDQSGERQVLKAYVSDVDGKAADKGSFVTVEMAVAPDLSIGNALNYAVGSNIWVDLDYQFALSGALAEFFGGKAPVARRTSIRYGGIDAYTFGMKTYGAYTYHYASFDPQSKSEKKPPLLVWLHGGGEGGSDPTVPLAANKATVFATPAFQALFMDDGIHVLIPQAPTYWMDGGEGKFGDGTSIYEAGLMQLIRDYIKENEVDENRVLVGGLSNGGYMTMLLARDYPEAFKGYLPVCEALRDEMITDEQIEGFAQLPMWFVAAHSDDTVAPGDFMLPTVERMKKHDPQNLQVTMYDKLLDKTGLYTNEAGEVFEYPGHWSWIEVYNNDPKADIDGKSLSVFEWLAALVN